VGRLPRRWSRLDHSRNVEAARGVVLGFLAVEHFVPLPKAVEPTRMHLVAFGYVFSSPQMALAFTGAFVVISQLKINVTNAYAGSIAWSNFFSRLTHSHPGRVVWLVFNVTIALMLMELGIFKMLEHAPGLYSIVAVSWVSALVANLVINKPLGLSPAGIEFKRAHLYDINPVGVGAMFAATVVGIAAFCGLLGTTLQQLSSFLALAVAFVMAPLIAWATHGRFYIARSPRQNWNGQEVIGCSICEHHFEAEDMAHCPAYSGAICSLCCSLETRCRDCCKPQARVSNQLLAWFGEALPERIVTLLNTHVGRYLGVLSLFVGVGGLCAAGRNTSLVASVRGNAGRPGSGFDKFERPHVAERNAPYLHRANRPRRVSAAPGGRRSRRRPDRAQTKTGGDRARGGSPAVDRPRQVESRHRRDSRPEPAHGEQAS
jgi:hypothetical protein